MLASALATDPVSLATRSGRIRGSELLFPQSVGEAAVGFEVVFQRNSENTQAMILPANSDTTQPSMVMIVVPRAKAPAIFQRVTA